MAHFVFGEKQIKNALASKIIHALNTGLAASATSIDPNRRLWLPSIFSDLLEELFCDSFAIRFIGPCYSFAFIEMFDIAKFLDKNGAISSGASPAFEFSESHPANLYRIKRHADILEKTDGGRS